MARDRYGNVIRWAGQRYGANYAAPYPGEHVQLFVSLDHAAEILADDPMGCAGDSLILWAVDPHDSEGEAISRTLSDAAHADRILTLGPLGGINRERV